MMSSRYAIKAYWGPRSETPAACAERFLRLLDALSGIDPVFSNWHCADFQAAKSIPLSSLRREDVVKLVAGGVSRNDDGTPFPPRGYAISASNSPWRGPRYVDVSAHAGCEIIANHFINDASIRTEPLDRENASFIDIHVMKPAMLAVASTWEATWCAAYPWDLMDLWPKPERWRPWRPRFNLAWMSYVSPRFASMVVPPRAAIAEQVDGGGLLMIATEERFDTKNPAHLAVARDIEAALQPVNALSWPPDAEPERVGP